MIGKFAHTIGRMLALGVIFYLPLTHPAFSEYPQDDEWQSIEETEANAADREKKAEKYFEKAKKHHEALRYREAIEEYQKALALNPDLTVARRGLAWAKRDMQRQTRSNGGGEYTLESLVKEAMDQYKRGRMFERENKPLEAAAAYKDALRMIPGYPEAREALLRVQSQAQRTLAPLPYSATSSSSKAPQAYEPLNMTSTDKKYKTIKPTAQISDSRLESTSIKNKLVQNQVSAAYKAPVSRQEASEDPQSIRSAIQKHYLTGCQMLDQGDYTTAIREFELIIEFDPTHREAQYKLNVAKKHQAAEIKTAKQQAEVAQAQGDTVSALSALRDIVNIDPNNEEALAAWEKTKRENKNIVSDIYRQGVTAYAKGEYTKALHAWELVLDIDPQNVKAQESIQKVREKMELIK